MNVTIQKAVIQILKGDGTLVPGLARGGIQDKWIKPGTTLDSTPSAFYVDPADPAKVSRLLPTISVLAGNEVDAVGFTEELFQKESFPMVHYFYPASTDGLTLGETMDNRVYLHLHNRVIGLTGGKPCVITLQELVGPVPLEGYSGFVTSRRRLRAEYIR